jgi:hypothetical protein
VPDGDEVDDDDDFPGVGGSAGTGAVGPTGGVVTTGGAFPMGGTVPAGGTFPTGGVSPAGGGPPTGGVGGIPGSGGTMPIAGVGGIGGANSDPECKGIRNGMACAFEGKHCAGLICGLADSGRRTCDCATTWACTTCDYTNSPFRDRPAMIPPCPADAADEAFCTQEKFVCGPVAPAEYCACYSDPTDGLIWDCDNAPSSWGI